MRFKFILAAVIGVSMGMTGHVGFNLQSSSISTVIELGSSQAFAGRARGGARRTSRRTARRTARRTTRRVARRQSIAGCSLYNAYYNCGGVYYRPIVESGTTVYIVVNP